jgi:hypothetical protein
MKTSLFAALLIILIFFLFYQPVTQVQVTNATYECGNVSPKPRAYVILRGYGDHGPIPYDYLMSIIEDPVMIFEYNETTRLAGLSRDLLSEFNEFIADKEAEELIIIGYSAGGTIALYSVNELDFNGAIELHTVASPLKGCNFLITLRMLFTNGFWRDVAPGLNKFTVPENVKVYHHKTIEDEILSQCGNSLHVQNNNVEGASEYYYNHTHSSILRPVAGMIIECYQ